MKQSRRRRAQSWSALLLLTLLLATLAACGQAPAEPATTTTAPGPATASSAPNPSAAPLASAPEVPTSGDTTPAASDAPSAAPAATDAVASAAPSAAPAATDAIASAAPSAAPQTETATATPRLEFGAAAHLYYTDAERVMALTDFAGFDWIRQQVPWKDTEVPDRTFGFQELDKVVATVQAHKKKLMLSVAKAPDWATGRQGDNGLPRDPKDFGRFVEELARRYKGKIHAIEIWNEQNLAIENGGRVVPEDAGRYVELLKESYRRIKAIDPAIVVVAGALSSTGVTKPDTAVADMTYYQAMYSYNGGEIKQYMDAQGFHPASALNPPDKLWPDDPGPGCAGGKDEWCKDRTHYFRHIEDVRKVMVDSGMADTPIWITEMGWATKNTTPGYEYGNQITLEQQADYLEGALFRTLTQYQDFVGVVFVWNLNFAVLWGQQGNPEHEQAAFGILNPDWSPRPAYTRIQGFINAVRQGH